MSIASNTTWSLIGKAVDALVAGDLVAFPTETVYGLGADAINEKAVAKIYKVKGRPKYHPLIVHISDLKYLDNWAREIPEYALKLARAFWPGPMTLILHRTSNAKNFITGGQDSIGIRIPNQTIALELLSEFAKKGGIGVAAPSANRFGAVSPTSSQAVKDELAKYLSKKDQILDGGKCTIGIESTIINCQTNIPSILRPGAITSKMIEQVTNFFPLVEKSNNTKVSGSFESHYAPRSEVLLNELPEPGDGFIALNSIATPDGVVRLAAPKSNLEFAKVLYQSLRDGDQQQLKKICVYLPIGEDISIAIRDRLTKAKGSR
jgi:L-threonylcarbamoyladenylate synthase